MASPRVFVSYTHDSEEHRRRILRLADRLRADGVDARLDRFVAGTPEGGWPAWMEREVDEADFVLVICTPNYHERYIQGGDATKGLGGRWESSLIRDSLYSDSRRLERFVPVLTKLSSQEDIPAPLRHRATHYRLDDYDGIFRHVTSQWETPPLPTGPLRVMIEASRSDASHDESPTFSSSITELYQELDRIVERLTNEQYDVIARLYGTSRALVSGSAGSGKTLVAAEKAMRLAEAGVRTLFVCHNPLLADWVARLVRGTRVDVRAFEDLVSELAAEGDPDAVPWSNYSEPTRTQLKGALQALESGGPPFAAVIVDEGQDFAVDWWPVVEALVPASGTLYVFFDEQQSLLPHRLQLPALGWPFTLSRNCRNAGRVYEVMRRLAPIRELPEQELEGLGEVAFFARSSPRESVEASLAWLDERGAVATCSTVLGGAVSFGESVLATGPFQVTAAFDWQTAVRQQLTHQHTVQQLLSRRGRPGSGGRIQTPLVDLSSLDLLSNDAVPSDADRAIVETLAKALATELGHGAGGRYVARVLGHPKPSRVSWRPTADNQRVPDIREWRLHTGRQRLDGADVLEALRSGAWADAVVPPATASFGPHLTAAGTEIPVYSIGEIKGLERDCVLLVLQGDAPQIRHELFVGVSRARLVLAAVLEPHAAGVLPRRLQATLR